MAKANHQRAGCQEEMFTQSSSPVWGAETLTCDDPGVAQRTARNHPIGGHCRHCGEYAANLPAHLDAQRAKERQLFLLQDRLENPVIENNRGSRGGETRMMKLIAIVGISWGGVTGLAIARGKDQMQRLEALFEADRTTV